MSVRALIPLAPGFEEIEAVTLIDVLRRAGIEVVAAALDGRDTVFGNHQLGVRADAALADVLEQDWDLIALPGGLPGADHLEQHPPLHQRLQRMAREGKAVAALCAAPKVLAAAGLLEGRRATSYPGFLDDTPAIQAPGAVVRDGLITTSRGPGTALAFALALVAQLTSEATAQRLAERMLFTPG